MNNSQRKHDFDIGIHLQQDRRMVGSITRWCPNKYARGEVFQLRNVMSEQENFCFFCCDGWVSEELLGSISSHTASDKENTQQRMEDRSLLFQTGVQEVLCW